MKIHIIIMDIDLSPLPISAQPGTHLSVDSRPGTGVNTSRGASHLSHHEWVVLTQWNNPYQREVSHYVTSPFKQGRPREYEEPRMAYDVGSELKRGIAQSITVYRKHFIAGPVEKSSKDFKNKTFHTRKGQGRLLPLLGTPVSTGPVIKNCVGIMPGNQRGAKTGQRGAFTTQNHLRNVADSRNSAQSSYLRHDRPRTTNRLKTSLLARESSIHRNSFTSTHSKDQDGFTGSEADEADIEFQTRAIQAQRENVTAKQNYFDNDLHSIERISRLNFVDS